MALSGLRMMLTFPSSPLRFRTAGFPRYGSQAGLSAGACPGGAERSAPRHGLHPAFASSAMRIALARSRGATLLMRRRRASGFSALPQGPSRRAGLCGPAPSSLRRPHPPHSPARPNFPAPQVICGAFAVPTHRRPRPPASGAELSHSFLLTLPSSSVPAESVDCIHPGFVDRMRLRPPLSAGLGTLNVPPAIRFMWSPIAGLPGSLSRYGRVSCWPRADLTGCLAPSQPRLLLPSLRSSRSPCSPSAITTVASGYLHRQDLHLLERLLASLHKGVRGIGRQEVFSDTPLLLGKGQGVGARCSICILNMLILAYVTIAAAQAGQSGTAAACRRTAPAHDPSRAAAVARAARQPPGSPFQTTTTARAIH
jgi:hypothetical protein